MEYIRRMSPFILPLSNSEMIEKARSQRKVIMVIQTLQCLTGIHITLYEFRL